VVPRPEQPGVAQRTADPTALWDRVLRARSSVVRHRNLPRSQSKSLAQAELLTALEAYVAYLTDHGRPIPYGLRDELRIRRLTRFE
jgi:hypothetical protein